VLVITVINRETEITLAGPHGRKTVGPEMEGSRFALGKEEKIGDSLNTRWPKLMDIIDDEPRPAGKIALAPRANKGTDVISRVRE
jgi:hypothetical protein